MVSNLLGSGAARTPIEAHVQVLDADERPSHLANLMMTTTEDLPEPRELGRQRIPAFVMRSALVERYEAEHGPGSLDAFLAQHAPLSFFRSS